MKTTTTTEMARTSQEFTSKRHFHWPNTNSNRVRADDDTEEQSSHSHSPTQQQQQQPPPLSKSSSRKKPQSIALSRIRAAFMTALLLSKNRASSSLQLPLLGSGCRRAVGTLFGRRRGHVQFALQRDAASQPAFFVELSTPIGALVKEMASGLVRIALECDKNCSTSTSSSNNGGRNRGVRLLEEPKWRTYCNGKTRGFATRKECGDKELRILKAIEPISMGAGVLPRGEGDEDDSGKDGEGELMYMRAKFERIIGSRDCEAFYMMNPDCNGAPELSIYLLRV